MTGLLKARHLLSVFVAFTLLLSLGLTANAALDFHEKFTINLAGTAVNECTGEVITYSGVLHVLGSQKVDSAGNVTFEMTHFNDIARATGSYGNTYVGVKTGTYTLHAKAGYVYSEFIKFTAISKGAAPNFITQALIHLTINPDGTITASLDSVKINC